MLPTPSTASRSKPAVATLVIKARESLGQAVNGVMGSGKNYKAESHELRSSLLRGTSSHQSPALSAKSSSLSSSPSSSSSSVFASIRSLLPSPKTAAFVVSCLLWYFASALSSNTSKALLSSPKKVVPTPSPPFPYPVTLTLIQFVFIHLLSSAVASPTLMRHVPGFRKPVTRIVSNPGWQRIGDMAKLSVFNVVGHALSTVAISRVPVSTVHTIKALTPLFTVLSFRFIFNVRYSAMAYFSLVPLTLGVMMACTSLSFSANDLVGLTTALASTFIFVAQSIYSKNLVGRASDEKRGTTSKDNSGKLDKINILYYTSACSIIIMIPMSLYYDGAKLFIGHQNGSLIAEPHASALYVASMVTANGIVQFAQNFLAFSVLALVSPVTYSIASLFKRVFVICFAIVWFGQSVSALQWLGIVLTFIGLYIYNDAKSSKSIAKGEEALQREERRNSFSLPMTNRDAAWINGDSLADATQSSSSSTAKQTAFSAHQSAFPVSATLSDHSGSASRSMSQKRGFGDFSNSNPSSAALPASFDPIPESSSILRTGPGESSSGLRQAAAKTQSQHDIKIDVTSPLKYSIDPRRSIPSPPPSRGPSSDDEEGLGKL